MLKFKTPITLYFKIGLKKDEIDDTVYSQEFTSDVENGEVSKKDIISLWRMLKTMGRKYEDSQQIPTKINKESICQLDIR